MEIHITKDIELVSIKLSGVIDEDNDLAGQSAGIYSPQVTIDVSEVQRINSCGVRDWVNWIHELEARGSDIFFIQCSPAIVAQINLVNNFTGSGTVKSFYVPYFCSQCDEEKTVLYEASDLDTSVQLPPAQRCDGCDRFMDFDDMSDAYFAFMRSATRVTGARKLPLPAPAARPAPPVPPARLIEVVEVDEVEMDTQVGAEIEFFETIVSLDAPHPADLVPRYDERRALHYLPWGLLAIALSALTVVLVAGA